MQEGALDRAERGVRPCNSDTVSYLPYTYLYQREGWGVGGVSQTTPPTPSPLYSVLANPLTPPPPDNRFRENRCIAASTKLWSIAIHRE